MAKFDESKVINALHPEKAEIGKKYWFSDDIVRLKTLVETNNRDMKGILDYITTQSISFHKGDGCCWRLLHPYEEPLKQRMTNIQLMEWISKRNGIFKYEKDGTICYATKSCKEDELNNEVNEDIVIRSWDSEEWIEPTVDIYERDCKKEK